MDTSFIELPAKINVDPLKYYKTTRDVCYWTNEKRCPDEILSRFTDKAKEYNYTEDQALAILMFNHFDLLKSEYDLQIYRPIKGLSKVDVKQLVKMISDGIVKTVKVREHRDFDDILLMFPGYTVGDVLGSYSKHRFLVKKETYKMKKSIKKSILKPYLTNGGLKEMESVSSWNDSCSDTQFQLVYQKHYEVIQNCSNFQELISRDLCDIRNYNGCNIRLSDSHDNETDVILGILRKMNRKRNKPGSLFEKSQLSQILSSAALARKCSSGNAIPIKDAIKESAKSFSGRSTHSAIPNGDSSTTNTEMSLEEQLFDYINSDNSSLLSATDPDCDEAEIGGTLKILSEQHEALLDSFKNYLPDPDIFQQLCHTWSNMDFAILLLGLSEFGKNFVKISDSIFTKSESMVASFFVNHSSEFNLDDIVLQPSRNTEQDPIRTADCLDEVITSAQIKIEETEPPMEFECLLTPKVNSRSTVKLVTKKKKSAQKSKEKESSSHVKEVPITMNLRSRLETNQVMKSLIDEERKLRNMKFSSKKRKPEAKGANEGQQGKRVKKSGELNQSVCEK